MPEPGKPTAEMTPEELSKHAQALRRWLRYQDVAAGRRAPTTMREIEIWRAGMAERDAQMAQLIARAKRGDTDNGADAQP